jgi:hypothetical protein
MKMPISSGPVATPARVVLYGPEGIGKTTFASQFPRPVFIDTEGSTEKYDVARAPRPHNWTDILRITDALQHDPQGFETLVVDTVDWAEAMCLRHVCDSNQMKGIEDFGYGKGYTYVCEEFSRWLNALRMLPMNIVLLAHAQTRKFELPEESGRFDRWELKLSKQCSSLVKEWATMVLFANYQIMVVEDAKTKTKKAQGGHRVLYTQHHACWDAKNRDGLDEQVTFEYASIAHCIPAKQAVPAPTPSTQPAPIVAAAELAQSTAIGQLHTLMQQDGVGMVELMAEIAAKGFFPADTPLANLPDDFIKGMLIPHWSTVVNSIKGVN